MAARSYEPDDSAGEQVFVQLNLLLESFLFIVDRNHAQVKCSHIAVNSSGP